MKKIKNCSAIFFSGVAVVFVVLIMMTVFEVGPIGVRASVSSITHDQLAVTPTNTDSRGVYVNTLFNSMTPLHVAVYNGSNKHPLYFGAGGADFEHAAKTPYFHVRVNATDSAEAARLLRGYLDSVSFDGTIAEIAVMDHGRAGAQMLGRKPFGDEVYEYLKTREQAVPATIYLVGCDVALGEKGKDYIQSKANAFGIRVLATADKVVWDITRTTGAEKFNFFVNTDEVFEAMPGSDLPRRVRISSEASTLD